jgi:small subunit ribosomal protein S20
LTTSRKIIISASSNYQASYKKERAQTLASHKSALKRVRQNEIRRVRNRSTKSRIKSIVKNIRQTAAENRDESTGPNLDAAKSIIDKASRRGVIHKKTASRKISRLARLVKSKAV